MLVASYQLIYTMTIAHVCAKKREEWLCFPPITLSVHCISESYFCTVRMCQARNMWITTTTCTTASPRAAFCSHFCSWSLCLWPSLRSSSARAGTCTRQFLECVFLGHSSHWIYLPCLLRGSIIFVFAAFKIAFHCHGSFFCKNP